jgi:hypothetical protein
MPRRDKHIPGKSSSGLPRKSVPAAAGKAAAVLMPSTGRLAIRWTRFDYEGPFCLSRSDMPTWLEVMKQCSSFESMTPMEIFKPGGLGKDYGEPRALPNAVAVERLKQLRLSDETQISRLRFTGRQRLYGVRRDLDFYAIFWDPEHEIWPSTLKHT